MGSFVAGQACGEGSIYKKNGEVDYGLWANNLLVEPDREFGSVK